MRFLFSIAFSVIVAMSAAAQQTPSATRSHVDNFGQGWGAVGRLDFGAFGFCTAALIAPDLIVTAAHCMFDKRTNATIPAKQMQFMAGWRNGTALAYRTVSRVVLHPNYSFEHRLDRSFMKFDMALLKLSRPIPAKVVRPFETHARPNAGARIAVVSYAYDRPDVPALQPLCHVLTLQDEMLVTSCDIDFGSSGAPVFLIEDGQARVVSVIAAKAQMRGLDVALGTTIEDPLTDLLKELSGPVAILPPDPTTASWPSGNAIRRQIGRAILRP